MRGAAPAALHRDAALSRPSHRLRIANPVGEGRWPNPAPNSLPILAAQHQGHPDSDWDAGERRNVLENGKSMKSLSVMLAAMVGVALVALAGIYWLEPAGSLPSFIPGFEAGSSHIHFKHGLGALILALALFAFAWFRSAPKDR